ncbi:MAG: presenilin family intramembrane aspartyl protease [Candidatus Nanohaloarchaeota archaeon QJJ-9]|nr:presenilin family intramembrane aspartyl protease [Candidatus Nanohaloarchaeota archaeon QJJ-9]
MPELEPRLILLFLFSHILGLTAALRFQSIASVTPETVAQTSGLSGPHIFLAILVATAALLGLYKLDLTKIAKLWFNTVILLTTFIFLSFFLPLFLVLGVTIALFVVRTFIPDLWTKNLIDSFSYAGAGVLFGTMIGFKTALILGTILTAYDFLSVFITKHMVSLAEKGIETGSFMGMVYPKGDKQVKTAKLNREGKGEKVQIGVLGGGDIIIPMTVAVAATYSLGILSGLMTSLGSAFGLAVLLQKGEKDKFYPAIPTIFGGAMLGLGLSLLTCI